METTRAAEINASWPADQGSALSKAERRAA